jgi:beta-galactosidase
MSIPRNDTGQRLTVRHQPWRSPMRLPRMTNTEDVRAGISLSSRYLSHDGRPWIPVSGEVHYSRIPRDRWPYRLRQVRAGGVTVVASYVPWLHHVARRGEPRSWTAAAPPAWMSR